jgi:NMD protein affecting ribosome stability and mRNA decay
VARLAKQRFGVPVVESASLFGRKQGQDVYRVTFCLRFSPAALDAAEAGLRRGVADAVER